MWKGFSLPCLSPDSHDLRRVMEATLDKHQKIPGCSLNSLSSSPWDIKALSVNNWGNIISKHATRHRKSDFSPPNLHLNGLQMIF